MRLFNNEIVELLNDYFMNGQEYVESILLASYGFHIQFVNFNIQCEDRVFASLNGNFYEWNDAPTSAPWGVLGRQLASKAILLKPELLRIEFESGDNFDIETVEGKFESVIFNFPPKDDCLVMEIF